MASAGKLRWLGISSLWCYRFLTWSLFAAGLAFAAIVVALRYWILPDIEHYRDDIARIVSERARQKITIERIQANWDGLRPHLKLENVTVYDAAGQPALRLSRMDQTLSWLSVVMFELRFHSLDLHRPTLNIRRDERGTITIAGIELSGTPGEGGFADWLLRQRDIEVLDATLVWTDAQRQAPPLELKHVFLQAYSAGGRHRFGLRAVPPSELAAPVDLRGDLVGDTLKSLAQWHGRLFLRVDYADIAAWRTWVPFPIEFPSGAGALRAWLSFEHSRLVDAMGDVRLSNVRTRLEKGLPELDLSELSGRVGWKRSETGFEITTSRLELVTTGGMALPPADFMLRHVEAQGRRPAHGEMQANALELAPLVALADRLPLGDEARKRLSEYSPRGALYDLSARWTGDWRVPQTYGVRGRFQNLAVNRAGRIPGFQGVSGSLDASEKGGTLTLNSHKTTVDMPLVFRDPLDFEAFTAQVAWTRAAGDTELRLNNISFSNPHVAGTVFGNFRTAGSTRGSIDLTGSLTRAEARFVSRYIPLVLGKNAREWLDKAFLAGQSSDVSLRLRGNLDEFPFADGKSGIFQVAAKVTGGALHYGEGWPHIEHIDGDLLFRGTRMDVNARQGVISGVRLAKVHVEIPDLQHAAQVLNVNGEAQGATADFLGFIEKSPVAGMTEHFTQGWQAQGSGNLSLRLSIPLRGGGKATVGGAYQFAGNTLVLAPELPALEQAAGRVEFTDSAVRMQNVNALVLGGPVTISATTGRDAAVRVALQGRVNTDAMRKAGGPLWVQHLRGTTDWRAVINARKRNADVVFESSLQGLAVDMPAPVTKTASEILPLRVERRLVNGGLERWSLSLGDIVGANLLRRVEGARSTITRGAVHFGGPAGEPERNGVWLSGAVKAFDLDRWLAMFGQGGGDTRVEWGGVDLKLGTLDVFRRRFSDLGVNAALQSGQWRATLTGGELDGTATWLPQGRGKLIARMKKLVIPAAPPAVAQAPDAGPPRTPKELELPALDITAEQFINKNKVLGRLELSAAAAEGSDWRIDRLRITNPESTFTLDGNWQLGTTPPRTQVNIRLEAADAGRLLTRLGYPEGLRRGTSKLEGALSWNGAPYDLDYPSLSGNLVLEAAKGQFIKLEPGIGKLLGILSLQALPRRIALDFRDVFSEGFSFDEIVGAVKIARGIAGTENFRIQGPAARITMNGDVDLARETQKLRVRVSPHVSDSVSIAGALVGGPIAGVAAFLAQKVLKDPLDQFISYEYSITGTWSDPAVARIERPAVATEPQSP